MMKSSRSETIYAYLSVLLLFVGTYLYLTYAAKPMDQSANMPESLIQTDSSNANASSLRALIKRLEELEDRPDQASFEALSADIKKFAIGSNEKDLTERLSFIEHELNKLSVAKEALSLAEASHDPVHIEAAQEAISALTILSTKDDLQQQLNLLLAPEAQELIVQELPPQ